MAADRAALWLRALVGMQATLMQVPPYILSERSASATVLPAAASAPASVLPPLPKPMMTASNFFM